MKLRTPPIERETRVRSVAILPGSSASASHVGLVHGHSHVRTVYHKTSKKRGDNRAHTQIRKLALYSLRKVSKAHVVNDVHEVLSSLVRKVLRSLWPIRTIRHVHYHNQTHSAVRYNLFTCLLSSPRSRHYFYSETFTYLLICTCREVYILSDLHTPKRSYTS